MSLNNLSATNISGALIDAGDFVINKRLVSNNQILYYTDPVTSIKTGYVWKGTLPHITSTNNPNTDGGISDTAWVPVIYSKLKEKMETEGLTLDWNAHLPTVEVAYGLTKNSLKMWKSGTTATSDDYWLYTDGTVWNGVGVLGNNPETSTGFEKITPNFNASIKTYSASATDGQTDFNIPFTFSTITVFVNGSIQLPGLNYTVSGSTLTFTTELEAGDLLYVFIGNPNISTNDKLNRIYTANAMQGQTTIQVPYDFSTAIVYINGVLQNPSTSYSIGSDRVITFSEELYQDDEIIIMLGDIIIQSDEYVLKSELLQIDAANTINTKTGNSIQYELDILNNNNKSSINYVTPEMFGAVGDGITDDTISLQAMFSSGKNISFPYNKTYIITDRLIASDFDIINGNGSTIKYSKTPTTGLTVLTIGKSKGSITNISVNVTEGDSTVTIPGISSIISVGDLLSLRSSTLRVPASESNYLFGQRCIVKSISGDTVTLFEPIYETFTITSCDVHSGKNHYEINNLNLDMTSVGSITVLVEGISITGVGMKVSNCNINGSNYCSAGLVLQGYNANIQNNIISGFLNSNGVASGGRTGYGIYIDCNNTLIQNNTISSNKHQVTCASRQFVMKGLVVIGNNASSYGVSTSDAVFDLHANVLGIPLFGYNTIHAGRSAFGIRNGGAKIIGNSIYSYRPNDTTPALVGLDEYQNVYYLEFSGNKLDCGTNIRLFSFGELNTINNLIIDSNIGTIGSIIDQAMNVAKINDLTITNNKLSGLSKIINANRRSSASTQTMFSELNRCNISKNYFNCTNDNLTDYVINLWTHANTLASNKLLISDLILNDNNIISTDTPIVFDFVKLTGITKISNNVLTHTISSGTITPPTQSSIAFNNTSVESLICIGNKISGRYRFTINATQASTSTAYPAEDLNLTVDIQSNTGLGITFENLVNSSSNRYTFGNSTITNNKFIGTYGTTIGFVTAYNPSGWNSGGIVSISNNLLLPASGNSVGIGLGWGSHKIAITNNIISASISDSSTPYLNINNNLVS